MCPVADEAPEAGCANPVPSSAEPGRKPTGDPGPQVQEYVIAYARYEWDCSCGEVNVENHDPSGEPVTCESCGAVLHCTDTR